MGMSSRIGADKITPGCWAEDVVTVMDSVGCDRATIFASGFTSASAMLLAADRPERVTGLVIVNGAARAKWAPDYEAGARETVAMPTPARARAPAKSPVSNGLCMKKSLLCLRSTYVAR